jgi:hypothetical protein
LQLGNLGHAGGGGKPGERDRGRGSINSRLPLLADQRSGPHLPSSLQSRPAVKNLSENEDRTMTLASEREICSTMALSSSHILEI